MTSKVILQPASNDDAMRHFVDTIENPVAIERIKSHLTPAQLAELSPIFEGRSTIAVWGVTPVNQNKWERIEEGDVTVFSGQGHIFASATVIEKIHNKALALDLWQTDPKGETWEYIYFLDERTEHKISYSEFNRTVGYKENYVIQGFNILDETKSDFLMNAFDLRSSVHFPDVEEKDYYQAISSFDESDSLDREVNVKGRIEQQFLRKILFGRRSVAECCICGKTLPVGLLWAAHIKKRSLCSLEERKDFHNVVAPMCMLGCDELYEKKYISVNSAGSIVLSPKSKIFPALVSYLDELEGKRCLTWRESNKKYFAWHYDSL